MSIKCSACNKKIIQGGIVITIDGDFVCDEQCKKDWETKRDHFFNDICHDPQKTESWLKGEID